MAGIVKQCLNSFRGFPQYNPHSCVITSSITKACLDLMVGWIHRYITHGSISLVADIARHKPFYSVCQAVFYVFAFKHKELLAMDKGKSSSQNLSPLPHRLIITKFKPFTPSVDKRKIYKPFTSPVYNCKI